MTQQNAAMIELATVAALRLKTEAADLASLMVQFRISKGEQAQLPQQNSRLRIVASGRSAPNLHRARIS